jgi:hypothetical protein
MIISNDTNEKNILKFHETIPIIHCKINKNLYFILQGYEGIKMNYLKPNGASHPHLKLNQR